MSGPFEIQLIPHRASLFLYGVSAAEFAILGCHELVSLKLLLLERAVVITSADSFAWPLLIFPTPLQTPAVAEKFVRLLLYCRMGLRLMGLIPLA